MHAPHCHRNCPRLDDSTSRRSNEEGDTHQDTKPICNSVKTGQEVTKSIPTQAIRESSHAYPQKTKKVQRLLGTCPRPEVKSSDAEYREDMGLCGTWQSRPLHDCQNQRRRYISTMSPLSTVKWALQRMCDNRPKLSKRIPK